MDRKLKGSLMTIAGGICWGASGSMGQYLFTVQGMDSRWLVPVRLSLSAMVLFVWSLLKYGTHLFEPWKDRQDRKELLIYGIAGISCCQLLYFLTIQLSSAGTATILQDLSPVMILLWGCLKDKRSPEANELVCIVLAIAGVALLTINGSGSHMAVPAAALLTGILSAVCVTVYNVVPLRLLARYPVAILQTWAYVLGSALFLCLFHPWTMAYVPTVNGWLGVAFVIIAGNVLAFSTYMSGIACIGPEKGILFGFSEPVTAALISALLLGSPFSFYNGFGFACIFLMLVLISFRTRSR